MPEKIPLDPDAVPVVEPSFRVYPVWTYVHEEPVVNADGKQTGAMQTVEQSGDLWPTMREALDAAKKAAPEGIGTHVDYTNAGGS